MVDGRILNVAWKGSIQIPGGGRSENMFSLVIPFYTRGYMNWKALLDLRTM